MHRLTVWKNPCLAGLLGGLWLLLTAGAASAAAATPFKMNLDEFERARKTMALAHWRQARGGGAWRVRACSVCGSGGAVQGGWAECAPELPARVHASQASP